MFLAVLPPVGLLLEIRDFLDDVGFVGSALKLVSMDRWHTTAGEALPAKHPEGAQQLDSLQGTPWTLKELVLIESTLRGRGGSPLYVVV